MAPPSAPPAPAPPAGGAKKAATKPKKKKAVAHKTICTGYAKTSTDLLQRCVEALGGGWVEEPLKKAKCDLYWIAAAREDYDKVAPELKGRQLVNRFPAMTEACNKAMFARLLKRAGLTEGEAFPFWPETWVIPNDNDELQAAMIKSKQTFIAKPDTASQGDGIFLTQSWDSLISRLRCAHNPRDLVVQRYLSQPLLLGGLKFDFRVYVLVKHVDPLDVWVCREGLARFCTEPYHEPSVKNMHNVMSHLTNYSLNKRSDKYDKADEEGTEGTKRYLSTTVAQLPPEAADPFWDRVDNIVACTMAAIQPPLADAYRRAFGDTERSRCFQILGFDVMLDKDGMPHLLEVNSHPSFQLNCVVEGTDCKCMDFPRPHSHEICPVDERVKVHAVRHAIELCTSQAAVEAMHDAGDEAPYVQVDCEAMSGTWMEVQNLLRVVSGKKMSSLRFRNFVTKAGIARGALASHESDLLYQKFKAKLDDAGAYSWGGDAGNLEEAMAFGDLLQEVARKKFPDDDPGEAMNRLMEQVARAYPEIR